ncbi:MAG: hypothetical protein ACE5JX_13050 [Acidobacteriota bacterium]
MSWLWDRVAIAVVLGVVSVCTVLLTPAQCSMCKTALAVSAEGKALAHGFNQGILFLVTVPLLLFATLTLLILRARPKKGPAGEPAVGDFQRIAPTRALPAAGEPLGS